MLGTYAKRIKLTVAAAAILASYAFIDHSLPNYTFVKFIDTGTRRFDEDGNYQRKTTASNGPTRDVEMIYTTQAYLEKDPATGELVPKVYGNGSEEKYKFTLVNEDTGFDLRTPYFKFDTADLQGSAAELKGQYGWIKSFGWRNQFFSWFHNALGVIKYEPGMTVTNWTRIIGTVIWAIAVGAVWLGLRRLQRKIAARVEAAAQAAKDRADALGDSIDAVGNRVDAFNNSEGMQTTRRRFWKIFGGWR
jgi:hypothetical protein